MRMERVRNRSNNDKEGCERVNSRCQSIETDTHAAPAKTDIIDSKRSHHIACCNCYLILLYTLLTFRIAGACLTAVTRKACVIKPCCSSNITKWSLGHDKVTKSAHRTTHSIIDKQGTKVIPKTETHKNLTPVRCHNSHHPDGLGYQYPAVRVLPTVSCSVARLKSSSPGGIFPCAS